MIPLRQRMLGLAVAFSMFPSYSDGLEDLPSWVGIMSKWENGDATHFIFTLGLALPLRPHAANGKGRRAWTSSPMRSTSTGFRESADVCGKGGFFPARWMKRTSARRYGM